MRNETSANNSQNPNATYRNSWLISRPKNVKQKKQINEAINGATNVIPTTK